MKTAVLLAAAISAINGTVQAEVVTLQWCVTLHRQFLDGVARTIYALPNAVVCETSKALAVYHEHYLELGVDEEAGKQYFVGSPEGSKCELVKLDAPFELMRGKTEEQVGGAMSVLLPPKQRFQMIIRVRRQGNSNPLFTSNRDWEFFISAKKAEMVDKLGRCCTLVREPNCLMVPR